MAEGAQQDRLPESVSQNVFMKSSPHPEEFTTKVKGYHFCRGDSDNGVGNSDSKVDYHALMQSFRTSGFQATNFGLAVEEINRMVCLVNQCAKPFVTVEEKRAPRTAIDLQFFNVICGKDGIKKAILQ